MRIPFAAAAAAAALLLASFAHADAPATAPEVRVREVVMAYVAHTNAHDAAALAGLFVPGAAARVLDNGRLYTVGRDGVQHVVGADLESTPGLRIEVSGDIHVAISPAGDAAAVDFAHAHYVTGDDGNEQRVFLGVISMTLFADGAGWQIASVHGSANPATMVQ